jgi:hypothetical protein
MQGRVQTNGETLSVERAAAKVRLNFTRVVPINGFDARIDRVDRPTR